MANSFLLSFSSWIYVTFWKSAGIYFIPWVSPLGSDGLIAKSVSFKMNKHESQFLQEWSVTLCSACQSSRLPSPTNTKWHRQLPARLQKLKEAQGLSVLLDQTLIGALWECTPSLSINSAGSPAQAFSPVWPVIIECWHMNIDDDKHQAHYIPVKCFANPFLESFRARACESAGVTFIRLIFLFSFILTRKAVKLAHLSKEER